MAHKDIYHINDGHFKGWSFYNDAIGSTPSGWTVETGYTVQQACVGVTPVHLKLLRHQLNDNTGRWGYKTLGSSYDKGYVELYMMKMDGVSSNSIRIYGHDGFDVNVLFQINIEYNVNWRFSYGVTPGTLIVACSMSTWYLLSIAFRNNAAAALPAPDDDLAQGKFRVYINGTKYGDYNLSVPAASLDTFSIYCINFAGEIIAYFDAIGVDGEDGYSKGDNLNTLDGTEFIAYCQSGGTLRAIEKYATLSVTTSERIYEGEIVKVYDEADALEYQGKIVPGSYFDGQLYHYESWDLAYSDLHKKVTLDYSSAATEIATIVKAAIDQVKTQVSYDAGSIPNTGITVKWWFNGTLLKDVLTYLAWRANAIWYLDPSDKIYFLEVDSLTDSTVDITEASNCAGFLVFPNMEFINTVYLNGANGLEGDGAVDSDLVAQYGERVWDNLCDFPQITDQTELESFEDAVLDLKGIKDPDAYKVPFLYAGSNFVQEGQEMDISNANIVQLIVSRTMIISLIEHDLMTQAMKVELTDVIVKTNLKYDRFRGKAIRQVQELAGKASGDLKSNYVVPANIFCDNQFTSGVNNVYFSTGGLITFHTNSYDSSKFCRAFFKLPSHYVAGTNFRLAMLVRIGGAGNKEVKYSVVFVRHVNGIDDTTEQTITSTWTVAGGTQLTGSVYNTKYLTCTDADFSPGDEVNVYIRMSDNAEAEAVGLSGLWIELL